MKIEIECSGYDTQVGVTDGTKEIQHIEIGDAVMAAGKDLKWGAKKVSFSSGVGPTPEYRPHFHMVYIQCINGPEIIVSPDQPFLMYDGKIMRASRLKPGDTLTGVDGGPIEIELLAMGEFDGGVHNISTDGIPNENLDAHLILLNGLVAGDYAVQIYHINEDPEYPPF